MRAILFKQTTAHGDTNMEAVRRFLGDYLVNEVQGEFTRIEFRLPTEEPHRFSFAVPGDWIFLREDEGRVVELYVRKKESWPRIWAKTREEIAAMEAFFRKEVAEEKCRRFRWYHDAGSKVKHVISGSDSRMTHCGVWVRPQDPERLILWHEIRPCRNCLRIIGVNPEDLEIS